MSSLPFMIHKLKHISSIFFSIKITIIVEYVFDQTNIYPINHVFLGYSCPLFLTSILDFVL